MVYFSYVSHAGSTGSSPVGVTGNFRESDDTGWLFFAGWRWGCKIHGMLIFRQPPQQLTDDLSGLFLPQCIPKFDQIRPHLFENPGLFVKIALRLFMTLVKEVMDQ
jgi:hypothetical protein